MAPNHPGALESLGRGQSKELHNFVISSTFLFLCPVSCQFHSVEVFLPAFVSLKGCLGHHSEILTNGVSSASFVFFLAPFKIDRTSSNENNVSSSPLHHRPGAVAAPSPLIQP